MCTREDQNLPEMAPGSYRLKYDLSVREGAGLNHRKRECGWKLNGMLPAGTKAGVREVKKLSASVWGRIQEGWICMYMSGTPYVEPEDEERA